MLKKTGFRLLGLAAMVSILFIAQAQTEEQGWKKTITLPSGEVVCDLNGEWDSLWTGRSGLALALGSFRDVVKITQEGNSFEGIRMIGNMFNSKGSLAVKGELDKDGFKNLVYYTGGEFGGSFKAKLSKDGNLIEFNSNDFSYELTRK